ncbi:hypothetical protein E2C01_043807 [Portunus trituberculatus]|uniref:Uncharacterized protein n=1 Tax=Portunus trituberculatus TaxID=210409 RepID=A0A5B7FQE9_PORTR|nr:hypothetical protein [Portunus trituberculatus]
MERANSGGWEGRGEWKGGSGREAVEGKQCKRNIHDAKQANTPPIITSTITTTSSTTNNNTF